MGLTRKAIRVGLVILRDSKAKGLGPLDHKSAKNGCSNCWSTCISGKANLAALIQPSVGERV